MVDLRKTSRNVATTTYKLFRYYKDKGLQLASSRLKPVNDPDQTSNAVEVNANFSDSPSLETSPSAPFASFPSNLDWDLETFSDTPHKILLSAFIKGNGIEVGALHNPQWVPPGASVTYVDKFSLEDLRKQYPEFKDKNLVDPKIIDSADTLSTIPDNSQDFVITSHVIEHCPDPIEAIKNMLRVVKPGGMIYMAVPDKRFTFDKDRPVTTKEHFIQHHAEGPEWQKREHFDEYARLVDHKTGKDAEDFVNMLLSIDYSIHYHVWTQFEFFEFLSMLRKDFGCDFDVVGFMRNAIEFIFVLRKGLAN